MIDASIRRYREQDRQAIREICFDTAFWGESASIFFEAKEIVADFVTLYFTDYEPESCFVAEVNGRVIGYLTGATNITRLKSIFITKVAPKLGMKFLLGGTIFRKENLAFVSHWLLSFLKGEFKGQDFSKLYPASLHINLKKDFRGLGIGSRLIVAYLDYLVKKDIPGVHLGTMSDKAGEFFEKAGFNLLHCELVSYFRYILHRDVPVYIYGKKLR